MDDNEEDKPSRTVRFYKDCLGIESTLRILCDESYIRYLSASKTGLLGPQSNLLNKFGVKYVSVATTSCVYAKMRSDFDGEGRPHDDDDLKYAINIHFQCQHHEPLPPETCLESVIRDAVLEPYFLASMDAPFRKLMKEDRGTHLKRTEWKNNLLSPEKGSQEKLKKLKRRRLRELERVNIKKQEKKIEDEAKMRELIKMEESYRASAPSRENYVSQRVILKRKRHRKKKDQSLMQECKADWRNLLLQKHGQEEGSESSERGGKKRKRKSKSRGEF